MDLRQPPTPTSRPTRLVWVVSLQLVSLAAIAALVVAWFLGGVPARDTSSEPLRDLASKLKAAGALDEAAQLYERYLENSDLAGEARARVAYSVGTLFLERGRYERALRWFYVAEAAGAGELQQEVGSKIVHTLERLGRVHAARAALAARTELAAPPATRPAGDPVVAKIGAREVYASDLQRELDDLPPQLAQAFPDRAAFLRKYVADELMANKARKLEYDQDAGVRRRLESLYKQLIVGAYLEKEILSKVKIDPADVRNFWEANRERYDEAKKDGSKKQPTFEEVRARVEQDYRMMKTQAAYQRAISEELAAEDVKLFPEKLADKP